MTISGSSIDGVAFDSLKEFHGLYRGKIPEQNHYVPVTADGAVSAHDLALARFRDAVNVAREKLELATVAMDKAAEDRDKAKTKEAERQAGRALESRVREKCQVPCSLPGASVSVARYIPRLHMLHAAFFSRLPRVD